MTKFGCHVIVLAYFWYFKLIFIFRGPIYGLFELFTNIWQPWKWNLTSYYCSGSLKTHESEFYFSGLPNFDNQGCHISLGRNCTNSIPAQENGQITSLKHPTVGIHGKFCCTFFTLVSWTVYIFTLLGVLLSRKNVYPTNHESVVKIAPKLFNVCNRSTSKK